VLGRSRPTAFGRWLNLLAKMARPAHVAWRAWHTLWVVTAPRADAVARPVGARWRWLFDEVFMASTREASRTCWTRLGVVGLTVARCLRWGGQRRRRRWRMVVSRWRRCSGEFRWEASGPAVERSQWGYEDNAD
jgi:hypothetical protein